MRLGFLSAILGSALLLMCLPEKAHASTIGDDVQLTLLLGSQTYDFGHANVTNGVEFQGVASGAFDLDVTANQVIVTFLQDRGFSGNPNFYSLVDFTSPFTSVSLDASTTAPFTSGLINSGKGSVGFSVSGLNFKAGQKLVLNTTNAIAVTPEPSSLIMLATGLFGSLGTVYRRSLQQRQSRNSTIPA